MAEKDATASGDDAIRVSGMQFAYEVEDPIFFDFNLDLPAGSRCLLVGANGSGKIIDFDFPLWFWISDLTSYFSLRQSKVKDILLLILI